MSHSDLLFELGCEDLPARLVQPLQSALADGMAAGLSEAGFSHGQVESFSTPRRLAVLIRDVPELQPEQQVERRGPSVAAAYKDGAPTGAAIGFARSCGVEVDALAQEDTEKGAYLVYRATVPGKALSDLIAGIVQSTLRGMDQLVPKRMRWGDGDDTFVRPVLWIVLMHGSRTLPMELFGLHSAAQTRGHRFHAPDPIELGDAADYELSLARAHVIAGFDARRSRIRALIDQWQGQTAFRVPVADDLLDEVSALVEWPVLVTGEFDAEFLELPAEVIVTTIEGHQRYFPVFDKQGAILNRFVTVSNIESKDPGKIVEGNERVVRPRLADAKFFWDQDLAISVDKRQARLAHVSYQKGLGSVEERAVRIADLAAEVAKVLGLDPKLAAHAGALCKNDLVSNMVFELPELQGIMGGHYLRRAGEPDAVAQAVAEHYRPAGPEEAVPESELGGVVALADKLDALAGTFASGGRPTASKDPFGMRRAANGVLRILLERRWPIDLHSLLGKAIGVQPVSSAPALGELCAFVDERLASMLYERFGFGARAIQAVRNKGLAVPVDAVARIEALAEFAGSDAAESLAAAHKRAKNILAKTDVVAEQAPDPSLFADVAEQRLWERLDGVCAGIDANDYSGTLTQLATLRTVVDEYFDEVMVNVEDAAVQRNRLATLAVLVRELERVADLAAL